MKAGRIKPPSDSTLTKAAAGADFGTRKTSLGCGRAQLVTSIAESALTHTRVSIRGEDNIVEPTGAGAINGTRQRTTNNWE